LAFLLQLQDQDNLPQHYQGFLSGLIVVAVLVLDSDDGVDLQVVYSVFLILANQIQKNYGDT
jgi:hypothetical protein